MKTMYKTFALGLVLVLAVLAPACRTTKKKTPPKTNTGATATSDFVPNVPVTVTAERVDTPPEDFVTTDTVATPTESELPRDIEQLNRVAQDRGLIRDAFFGYNESALNSNAQAALNGTANWLRNNTGYNLLIEGHCDERGTEQYNLALGDRRAAIVRDYLVTLGVDGGRIRTVSYGEERPFEEGHDESSWSQNRRAHLVLTGSNR